VGDTQATLSRRLLDVVLMPTRHLTMVPRQCHQSHSSEKVRCSLLGPPLVFPCVAFNSQFSTTLRIGTFPQLH
jgi:hypothetical protein